MNSRKNFAQGRFYPDSPKEIEEIFKAKNLNTLSVYTSTKPKTSPLDKMELIKRRRSVL